MEALVTASGEGTRLRPLTDTIPKALVKVCGRPIIDYILSYLNEAGIRDEKIAITIGYKRERVLDYLSSRLRRYITSYKPESMAHVITVASHLMTGPFVVVEGDTIQPASAITDSYSVFNDLKLSVLFHCPTKDDKFSNRVISFEEYLYEHDRLERETNGKKFIKYTAVFYEPRALQDVEEYVSLRDEKFKHTKIAELINRNGGMVRCLFTSHWYVSINTPEELADAEKTLRLHI